jgi:hypothetical protein
VARQVVTQEKIRRPGDAALEQSSLFGERIGIAFSAAFAAIDRHGKRRDIAHARLRDGPRDLTEQLAPRQQR